MKTSLPSRETDTNSVEVAWQTTTRAFKNYPPKIRNTTSECYPQYMHQWMEHGDCAAEPLNSNAVWALIEKRIEHD
jgi:hypothetical protein